VPILSVFIPIPRISNYDAKTMLFFWPKQAGTYIIFQHMGNLVKDIGILYEPRIGITTGPAPPARR
jgi:hypothetical protein